MRPPSLLSLTLDSALLRIAHIADLSHLPDHLVIDLFRVGTPPRPRPPPLSNLSPLLVDPVPVLVPRLRGFGLGTFCDVELVVSD
jgi:hypothetical protein